MKKQFNEQIAGHSAKELMTALPSLPKSTAYDWLSGHRCPPVYLQPLVVQSLKDRRKKEKIKSKSKVD